jgi:hypothetical protein
MRFTTIKGLCRLFLWSLEHYTEWSTPFFNQGFCSECVSFRYKTLSLGLIPYGKPNIPMEIALGYRVAYLLLLSCHPDVSRTILSYQLLKRSKPSTWRLCLLKQIALSLFCSLCQTGNHWPADWRCQKHMAKKIYSPPKTNDYTNVYHDCTRCLMA